MELDLAVTTTRLPLLREHHRIAPAPSQIFPEFRITSPQPSQFALPSSQATTNSSQLSGKRWSNQDLELLLEWFAGSRNLELYKTKAKDALAKISSDVFDGRRTPSSIKAKWDSMKDRHRDARARLESTGEGEFNLQELQMDGEKWNNIQQKWLNKMCPYFEELDDILQRDKSYTPYYVSESGGLTRVQIFSGSTGDGRLGYAGKGKSLEIRSDSERGNSGTGVSNGNADDPRHAISPIGSQAVPLNEILDEDSDGEEVHPPAGGNKNPLKRGGPSGGGQPALKKRNIKKGSAEDLIREQYSAKLALEQARFAYEKERDALDREHMQRREENRHKESMMRVELAVKQFELMIAKLNNERSK